MLEIVWLFIGKEQVVYQKILLALLVTFFGGFSSSSACSVVYYIDKNTHKIYVANNEDYWYDAKPYIKILPKSRKKLARLWYGWKNFAQGGINEAGLFFDGAVTPEQKIPAAHHKPKGNLGDDILAYCKTVDEAIDFMEVKRVALANAHMMFGDSTGNAAVLEWVDGKRKIVRIKDNKLVMTNFLLSDTTKGNYPCYRYNAIEKGLQELEKESSVDLKKIGNVIARAVQPPRANEKGRIGGTLYSTFINISDMQFVLVFKLDNSKIIRLNLKSEFKKRKKQKIKLQ